MGLSWKEKIEHAQMSALAKYVFQSPITSQEIKEFRYRLKIEFPEQLLSLYEETNGVVATLDDMNIGDLIWPSCKVIEENLKFRQDKDFKRMYVPFNNLLFFADNGFGDQFAFKLISGLPGLDIYSWEHEDDRRTQIAPSLESFIIGWISGNISA